MPAALHTVEIGAPLEIVSALILDFASYPRFLPDMAEATVLRTAPGEWEVAFQVVVLRPLRYTLLLTARSPTEIRWSLVEGAFRSNEGGWTLEAIGPTRTRATYRIDLSVGHYVPGNIVRSLIEVSLPAMLARFKAEAERRALGLPEVDA